MLASRGYGWSDASDCRSPPKNDPWAGLKGRVGRSGRAPAQGCSCIQLHLVQEVGCSPTSEVGRRSPTSLRLGRASRGTGCSCIQLHLAQEVQEAGRVALPRRWGGASPRPDCGGCHCAQPSCWCIDTLRSHLVVVVFVHNLRAGALTPRMMVQRVRLQERMRAGQAPTVAVVIVRSLRAGALTPCGPILWWSSVCSASVLVH